MKKYFTLIFLLFPISYLKCQNSHTPIGVNYTGLGCYSLKNIDPLSITGNIASLANIQTFSFGMYIENRYLLKETNYYSGLITAPLSFGHFAFQVDYFGFKNYNESQIGLSYAKSLGNFLDLGLKFNLYSFKIPQFINTSAVDAELGLIYHLSDKIHAGLDIYNPIGGYFDKIKNEKLSSVIKLGVGYEASNEVYLTAGLCKEINKDISGNIGFQYNLLKKFFLRVGTSSDNAYAGAGLSWNNYRLDITTSFNQHLGISPGVMLLMNFKKTESGQ